MGRTRKQQVKLLSIGLVALVFLVLGGWLVLSENSKHDKIVVSDLSELNAAVQQYAATNRHLPYVLDMLPMADLTRDRLITNKYTYKVIDSGHYQLCARFTTDNPGGGPYALFQTVHHGAGDQCFSYGIPASEAHS